jgi:hypothetical protein
VRRMRGVRFSRCVLESSPQDARCEFFATEPGPKRLIHMQCPDSMRPVGTTMQIDSAQVL